MSLTFSLIIKIVIINMILITVPIGVACSTGAEVRRVCIVLLIAYIICQILLVICIL